MRYFSFLEQIFHLSLPKIWQAHPNINYLPETYMKRQIISKRFKALTVIMKRWQALELLVILSRFFSKIYQKTPLCKLVAMETLQDLDP